MTKRSQQHDICTFSTALQGSTLRPIRSQMRPTIRSTSCDQNFPGGRKIVTRFYSNIISGREVLLFFLYKYKYLSEMLARTWFPLASRLSAPQTTPISPTARLSRSWQSCTSLSSISLCQRSASFGKEQIKWKESSNEMKVKKTEEK